MHFLPLLVLAAIGAAQTYPGEAAAREAVVSTPAAAVSAAAITPAPVNGSAIPSHFQRDLNYLHARADAVVPGVYVCRGPGWTGECVWQRMATDTCMRLWDSPTLAVGPDIGIQCKFWLGTNCDGQATTGDVTAPGQLEWTFKKLPRSPQSYKCHACDDPRCGQPGISAGQWSKEVCVYPIC